MTNKYSNKDKFEIYVWHLPNRNAESAKISYLNQYLDRAQPSKEFSKYCVKPLELRKC